MRLFAALFVIIGVGCRPIETAETAQYFDMQELVSAQLELLKSKQASLLKTAYIGSDSAKTAIPSAQIEWENELSVFERIDLNKPKWRDQYDVSESDDQFSNLKIKTYSAKAPDAEVLYLRVYYLESISDLRKIECSWKESNPIYNSQRNLVLHFDEIRDEVLIKAYEVEGVQKMMFQEEVSFYLKGDLIYD